MLSLFFSFNSTEIKSIIDRVDGPDHKLELTKHGGSEGKVWPERDKKSILSRFFPVPPYLAKDLPKEILGSSCVWDLWDLGLVGRPPRRREQFAWLLSTFATPSHPATHQLGPLQVVILGLLTQVSIVSFRMVQNVTFVHRNR